MLRLQFLSSLRLDSNYKGKCRIYIYDTLCSARRAHGRDVGRFRSLSYTNDVITICMSRVSTSLEFRWASSLYARVSTPTELQCVHRYMAAHVRIMCCMPDELTICIVSWLLHATGLLCVSCSNFNSRRLRLHMGSFTVNVAMIKNNLYTIFAKK